MHKEEKQYFGSVFQRFQPQIPQSPWWYTPPPPMTYTPPDSPTKGSTTSSSLPGNHTLLHRPEELVRNLAVTHPSHSQSICVLFPPTSPSSCCCSPTCCTGTVGSALPAFARLISWQDTPLTGHGSFPILPFPVVGEFRAVGGSRLILIICSGLTRQSPCHGSKTGQHVTWF